MNKILLKNNGFSLVELMISMLIGLMILGGIFQIIQLSNRNYALQEVVQKIQKDGRFATNEISRHIRMSGYSGFYGKLNLGVENLLNNSANELWDISTPLSGFDNINQDTSIAGVKGFKKNTDVILLKNMHQENFPVKSNPTANTLIVDNKNNFSAGDILFVSDIDQATLFQVNTKPSSEKLNLISGGVNPGNSSVITNSYNSNAEIGKYQVTLFGIKNGRNGLPALFKISLENIAGVPELKEEELVSNINDMQINYGIDTNDDRAADTYIDAGSVPNWENVVSVNVALLAVSKNTRLMDEADSYSYDRDSMRFTRDATPSRQANKSLKRPFSTFAPLRN